MTKQTMQLIIEDVRELAPGVRHIAFRRQDSELCRFKPGQFITFLLPGKDALIRRNYSVATIPNDAQQETDIALVEIALTYVDGGIASEQLFAVKPGDCLDALEPSGRLLLREEDQPAHFILVATGTGVTPYRAMLPQLAARFAEQPDLKVTLLFGIRTPQHVLYEDDFIEFANTHPNFRWHCCYSRELPDQPNAYQHRGYVQQYLPTLPLSPQQDIVYLCGNPVMVDEAYTYLKTQGFAVNNVRREKYISGR